MAAGGIGQDGDVQALDQLVKILSRPAFAAQGYGGDAGLGGVKRLRRPVIDRSASALPCCALVDILCTERAAIRR